MGPVVARIEQGQGGTDDRPQHEQQHLAGQRRAGAVQGVAGAQGHAQGDGVQGEAGHRRDRDQSGHGGQPRRRAGRSAARAGGEDPRIVPWS